MKTFTILLMALVVTLILNGPIQSYADPQLDTLVNIATQARNNLNISISQISNIPDEIASSYKQGSNETDALTQAANRQDVESAKQHFLAAMNFFKTTNDEINALNATETNDQQHVEILQLQSEITRLEKTAGTLQTIAITNHVDFNFTQFDTSLKEAKQDLVEGKINEADKLLDTANQLIINAHQSLSDIAQQRTTDRAKDFTETQIERFDKMDNLPIQNVTMPVSNITISETNSSVTSAENPGKMILKLKKLLSEGNVEEALKVIKSLDTYQKETIQHNENQLESEQQTGTGIQNNTMTNNNFPITANITTSNTPVTNTTNTIVNPDKTNSSDNESGHLNNDKKMDKISSSQTDNFNEQNKDDKSEFYVIPQGNFDPEQQDKTHERDSGKVLEKQKKEQKHN